jgi:hydroxyethylthiazole kinase
MPAEGDEMHNSDALSHDAVPQIAAAVLDRLRTRAPRVHCITNAVAQNFTANVLLASGAVPSMTLSSGEIGAFVSRSDALLVNLGTFDRERREATVIAVEAAAKDNVPWVLDPVFVERSLSRASFARDMVVLAPKVARLNQDEFAALARNPPTRGAVGAYARDRNIVVGLSGETDLRRVVADCGLSCRRTGPMARHHRGSGHNWRCRRTGGGEVARAGKFRGRDSR